MEQRRFFLSLVFVSLFFMAWMQIAPRLLPGLFPKAQPKPVPAAADKRADGNGDPAPNAAGARVNNPLAPAGDVPEVAPADAAAITDLPDFPQRTVTLGSLDPDSAYYAQVTLTSTGAAVQTVELNDPRFRRLDNRKAPIKIVGNDSSEDRTTLNVGVQQIDAQLAKYQTSLENVDWEVVPESLKENAVTFRYRSPDEQLEVRKHFLLNPGTSDARDVDPIGYLLQFDLGFENLGDRPAPVNYVLQGPVGLPLENAANSRSFIGVIMGALESPEDPSDVTALRRTAAEVIKDTDKARQKADPNLLRPWGAPVKYTGVDVQFFAALICPEGNQLQSEFYDAVFPELVRRADPETWSDLSVTLHSVEEVVPPGETLTRSSRVFFGPKRSELLEALGAGGVIEFGWFGAISVVMLNVLNFFHRFMPYGLAIILLTVCVRACLFPVSRKQALNAKRMKELQPKMQEIRERYKDDKQKMAEAMQEFMVKHKFNPLSGCLPMFLQLPILIGLYQALYNAVDLRLARFLWIDNLAAPDALFKLPFDLPFLGHEFNLLPLITVVLFYVQQKLFMPPPTSEEQAMQYKMMNFMMLFMGVIFYRVPAGLCVYFIASTLWGIGERKMLDFTMPGGTLDPSEGKSEPPGKKLVSPRDDTPPKPPGLFGRLMEAADQARQQTNGARNAPPRDDRRGGGKKRSKGRR